MQTGKPSRTALRVAIRRAAHQIADPPSVLEDPIALRLIGSGHKNDLERAMHPVGRDFRAFMAARSRYAEDHLAQAVACGVLQYVILGAGLDTFAYRNPFPQISIFEVDFPATQEWKRSLLADASIEAPENLVFVPLDFEHKALADGLRGSGVDLAAPAYFSWLGVVPYLTDEAFQATITTVARLPGGTGLTFDYALPPGSLRPKRREIFDRLAGRLAAEGEPFRLFFTPDQAEAGLRRAGFRRIEQADYERLNALYFKERADGLKLSPVGIGMLATGWT
jgi:methyltransferase (TIGR00027 family)